MYALEEMFVSNYPSKLNSFLLKRYTERQFHLLLIKCVLLATTIETAAPLLPACIACCCGPLVTTLVF